jgi:K+-transporting ATPase ATPase A chain
MVGRTPEYLGKKIQAYDVQMSMLYVLVFTLSILTLSAVSLLMPQLGFQPSATAGPMD